MTVAHPPISSGIPAVDHQWGGFSPGKAYLLTGRAGAGRSGLALQAAHATIEEGLPCLLISPREPNALVEIGRAVGVDLPQAHASGRLRILRIPEAAVLAARGPKGLEKSYRDLIALVESNRPARVVIEDFTPLVQFDTFERFHEELSGLAEALRRRDVTLVLGLGDPANDASRRLIDVVETVVDGTVRLGPEGEVQLARPPSASGPDPSEPAALEPDPFAEADAPEAFSTRDGASVDTHAPELTPPEPVAPPALAEPPPPDAEPGDPFADLPAAPDGDADPPPPLFEADAEADMRDTYDVPPRTDVVPAPAPDPALLLPADDLFGLDPVDPIMEQGFLADSALQDPEAPEMLSVDTLAPEAVTFPLPEPERPAAVPLPAFAPLGGAPPAGFHPALDAAFAARQRGVPFLVVAIRMEPSAPEAAHYDAVEAGLRSALRSGDEVLVDASRKRAVVVLPSSGPEAGQALFEALQSHLRSALGAQAEPVLRVVAAVTIPDGQPFETPADLLAYAYEG